jgi:hypothetical protein
MNHFNQLSHFENWWHLVATPHTNRSGQFKQKSPLSEFAFIEVLKVQNSIVRILHASKTQRQPQYIYFLFVTFLFTHTLDVALHTDSNLIFDIYLIHID